MPIFMDTQVAFFALNALLVPSRKESQEIAALYKKRSICEDLGSTMSCEWVAF